MAIKVVQLPQGTTGSSDPAGERFRREAVTTAALNHPSIVSVFDTGTEGPASYLVMELVAGSSVATLISERGPLPLPEALHIAVEVASALTAAHAAGIVHRDIKPANVMVHGSRVTVLDFGIAHLQSAEMTLTEPETAIGTAAYMAPEQAAGGKVGPAADTYALGCLLMAMVSGHPPYRGDHPISVATQQISAPVPRVSSRLPVPAALDTLVGSMLSKKAFDRPDLAEVQRSLRAILANPAPRMVGPGGASAATAVLPTNPTTTADAAAVTAVAASEALPTAVLPPASPVASPVRATPLAPAPPTAIQPALPPAIHRASGETGYQTFERNPMPGEHRGWWKLPLAVIVIVALGGLAFAYASSLGYITIPGAATPAPVSSSNPSPSVSSRPPSTSAAPVPSTTKPTPTPSVATSSARPSSGKATPPSARAVEAAVKTVAGLLNNLDDSKAKTQLLKSWDTTGAQIIAGKQGVKAIDQFGDAVTGYQQAGDLTLPEALGILAALEALKLLV